MDHTFKKRSYTLSVGITIIFMCTVAATLVDNASCPMLWQLILDGYNTAQAAIGAANVNSTGTTSSDAPPHPLLALVPTSIFDPLFHYFPCNMIDLLLHIYVSWFIMFMGHKWIVYKREGMHYFMLDYCYFHNLNFIAFLLILLVKVEVGVVLNSNSGDATEMSSVGSLNGASVAGTPLDKGQQASLKSSGNSNTEVRSNASKKVKDSAVLRKAGEHSSSKGKTSSKNNTTSNIGEETDTIGGTKVKKAVVLDNSRVVRGFWRVIYDLVWGVVRPDAENSALASVRFYGLDAVLRGTAIPLLSWCESTTEYYTELRGIDKKLLTSTRSYMPVASFIDSFLYPWSSFYNASVPHPQAPRVYASFDIRPLREAVLDLSPSEQEVLVAIFLLFLSGSFGPILGAILAWRNALLFHSIDKMTACFLHLAPAFVQLVIMDSVVASVTMSDFSVRWLVQSITSAQQESGEHQGGAQEIAAQMLSEITNATHLTGLAHLPSWLTLQLNHTSNGESAHNVDSESSNTGGFSASLEDVFFTYLTYPNWIIAHSLFFLLWQVFYHSTYELLRVRRELKVKINDKKAQLKRKLDKVRRKILKEPKPQMRLLSSCGTNPTDRVTAYTYMMEHPPMGRNGPLFKAVHVFGDSTLATKTMFNVLQWFVHLLFLSLGYIPIALGWVALYWHKYQESMEDKEDAADAANGVFGSSYHHHHQPVPQFVMSGSKKGLITLFAYVMLYVIFAVWNASLIMKKWIGKLQTAAAAADDESDENKEGNNNKTKDKKDGNKSKDAKESKTKA